MSHSPIKNLRSVDDFYEVHVPSRNRHENTMGKVTVLINMTPDGFAGAELAIADEEFYDFSQKLLEDTGAIAFGRVTFEIFRRRWTSILETGGTSEPQNLMAKTLQAKHKVVYSSTLKTVTWDNTTIQSSVDADSIRGFKQSGHAGLLTLGSPTLVEQLIALKLVDEFYFFMQPLIAGKGSVRLFDKTHLGTSCQLRFVTAKHFRSGVHVIHYRT